MVGIMTLKSKQPAFSTFSNSKIVGMMWVLALILLWGEVRQAQAGCQRFGHSCFGAHGKRAELPSLSPGEQLSPSPGESNYPEMSPQYYPPLQGGGMDSNRMMSPYLMEWLMSARRGQGQFLPINYGRDDENRRRK